MQNECNCPVVWAFFGTALLRVWNEIWPFPVLWALLTYQICWHIECSTWTASFFKIWNSSAGIVSPPVVLSLVMLPKAQLTSHSRMSGSRWLTIPLWLSGSLRPFLYSSSIYCSYCFPGGSNGKASVCNEGDPASIPGLGRSLENKMAMHSSSLAWKIPWAGKPGRLQSMGSQRVRHKWETSLSFPFSVYSCHLFLISSIKSLQFLSFIMPFFAWNVPLISVTFLKWSLVLPILLFFSTSLHCSLKKAFLCPFYSLELCIQVGISFPSSFAFSLSSFLSHL